jgi:uncharacterized protein (DUF1778 family)
MSSTITLQSEPFRLNLLLPPELEALLAEAARIRNASLDDFALSALEKEARSTIANDHVIKLSLRDRDLFLAALDEDVEPTDALRRAMRRHQEVIQP